MARRTRTYVAFDADSDIRYYRLMQAWHANDGIDFDFNNAHDLTTIRPDSGEEAIKASLRERMRNSNILVVLVGEKTRFLRKYVPWEIELAMKAGLPIIVANLNGKNGVDTDLCPQVLQENLSVHVPFGADSIQHAIDNWPAWHAKYQAEYKRGTYSYNNNTQARL